MSHPKPAKNLLIVDDNPGDIDLLRQVIERIPGVTVHVAHNVMQAHAYLNRMYPYVLAPVPDLILLDIRMPMLSGENVIPLIRRDPLLQQVKIVMFTSSARPEDQMSCNALGADDYVVKPSDWSQWQTTIGQVLARHGMLDEVG